MLKLLHRHVVETTGSRLVVFKARLHTRQFVDVIRASLSSSSMPSGWKPANECVFVTIPACVVEHAFPVEAAGFAQAGFTTEVIDLKTLGPDHTLTEPSFRQRLSSSDAGAEARHRLDVRAFLHAGCVDTSTSAVQGPPGDVIDLTGNSETDSEIEIIG